MSQLGGPDAEGRRSTCAEVQDLAPELAIGLLSGTERARALAHLVSCATCQELVEQLSGVADRLLLLAPDSEPPAGFEMAVLDRLGATPGRAVRRDVPSGLRRHRRRWLAVAAALVVVSGATGVVVQHQRDQGNHLDREYVAALHALGGSSLRAAPLEPSGRGTTGVSPVGEVFVYSGRTSWLFIDLHSVAPDGVYRVRIEGIGATSVPVGSLTIVAGSGSWGGTAPMAVARSTGVSVVASDGTIRWFARLPGDSDGS